MNGARQLAVKSFNGRAHIFYSSDNPGQVELASGYSIANFSNELTLDDPDFAEFFLELTTKAPFTDHITHHDFAKLTSSSYSINGWSSNVDIHIFALIWKAFLLSLPLHTWNNERIPCHSKHNSPLYIDNIFDVPSALGRSPKLTHLCSQELTLWLRSG